MRRLQFLCVALLLSACTVLPDNGAITSFGDSTAKTASAFKKGVEYNSTLALEMTTEYEATRYIDGEEFDLRATGKEMVPAATALAPKLAALAALEQYGKAIAEASNPQGVTELQAAATQLVTATTQFAATQSPGTASLTGPAGAALSHVAGIVIMNNYAGKVRKIIASQDSTVQRLAALLKEDAKTIAEELALKHGSYGALRQESLKSIADKRPSVGRPTVDRLRLYNEFKVAQREVAASQQMATALDTYAKVLDAMVKAHHALATNKPDAAVQVAQFNTLVDKLAELLKAFNTKPT